MSLLTLGIWVFAIIAVLTAGINFLPTAAAHPYPAEISTAIHTLWSYLLLMNDILPLDTLLTIFGLSIVLRLVTDVIYPSLFTFMRYLRGSSNS